MFALTGARVLVGDRFEDDAAVLVDGARVAGVVPTRDVPAGLAAHDLAGLTLAPGFVDVQVNGGGDALFNDDPSVETIRRIGAAHRRFGTTGFLPTLISDELDVIRAGIAAAEAAIAEGVPGVLGIHVEGPFINVGRKGIHDPARIRPLDDEALAVLCRPGAGCRLVTVAPETVGPNAVRRLAAAGVIVSAGHTASTYAELVRGFDAGVTGVTHLFNAMSPLTSREPGAVGAALHDPRPWCSLIADGHHVDAVTMQLALRCKPADRFLLVSDAMPPTGGRLSTFRLNGRRIAAAGGRLVADDGTLAGADLDMMAAVRGAVRLASVRLETALAMASAHPAAFLGMDGELGRIAAGHRASLVAFDEAGVKRCWIDGTEDERAARPA
jgi:N-acetylglucosamine-6-phosphate deacetylase